MFRDLILTQESIQLDLQFPLFHPELVVAGLGLGASGQQLFGLIEQGLDVQVIELRVGCERCKSEGRVRVPLFTPKPKAFRSKEWRSPDEKPHATHLWMSPVHFLMAIAFALPVSTGPFACKVCHPKEVEGYSHYSMAHSLRQAGQDISPESSSSSLRVISQSEELRASACAP